MVEYLKEVKRRGLLQVSLKKYEDNPNDVSIGQTIGTEIYNDPTALSEVAPEVLEAYVKVEVPKREKALAESVRGQTEDNLEGLIGEVVSGINDVDEGLGLLASMPYTPGFSNKKADNAYRNFLIAKTNERKLESNAENEGSEGLKGISVDIMQSYGISEEVIKAHLKLNPESLVRIYKDNVIPAREEAVKEQLESNGKPKKSVIKRFMKYLISNGEGDAKNYALDNLSQMAYASYAKNQ